MKKPTPDTAIFPAALVGVALSLVAVALHGHDLAQGVALFAGLCVSLVPGAWSAVETIRRATRNNNR